MRNYWHNPYKRWTWRWAKEWISNLVGFPGYLRRQIRLIREWLPVIWEQKDWDYSWLYKLLAYKFERMERGFRQHGMSACWENQAREIQICKTLMRRLATHEYIDWGHAEYQRHPYFKSKINPLDYEESRAKQDREMFCRIFLRKVNTWWD